MGKVVRRIAGAAAAAWMGRSSSFMEIALSGIKMATTQQGEDCPTARVPKPPFLCHCRVYDDAELGAEQRPDSR